MKIRKATLGDAHGIAKVHVDSWRSTYKGIVSSEFLDNLSYEEREKRWISILQNDNYPGFTYVAEDVNGSIVAFANGGPEREKSEGYEGELYAIYILQSSQRKGIGKELFENVIKELLNQGMKSMLIWVLEENESRGFYKKMGGIPIKQQEISIGGNNHTEIAYGWRDLGAYST